MLSKWHEIATSLTFESVLCLTKKFSFTLLSLWQWIFLLFSNGSNKIQKRNLLINLANSQASSFQQVWEGMYSFSPELSMNSNTSMNSNHINFTVRQHHWLCISPTVQGNIINVNISHSINDTPQLASWRGPCTSSQKVSACTFEINSTKKNKPITINKWDNFKAGILTCLGYTILYKISCWRRK